MKNEIIINEFETSITGENSIIEGVKLNDLIHFFVNSQDVCGSSRKEYERSFRRFLKWAKEEGKVISEMTRPDIVQYKDFLKESGLSTLTQNSYLIVVRKFFEWTESEKLYPNIARGVKGAKRTNSFEKQYLQDEDSSKLLKSLQERTIEDYVEGKSRFSKRLQSGEDTTSLTSHFETVSLRDFAIVNLMIRTGLRTIEVTRLDISDIVQTPNGRILKIWGKGRDTKDNDVNLSEKAYEPIRRYLETSRKGATLNEPLFTSTSHNNFGKRLTTRTISGLCKEGLKSIGRDGREYTAHSLRHTTACALLEHGCTLEQVQRVLRHKNSSTTQIYTKLKEQEMYHRIAPETILDGAF